MRFRILGAFSVLLCAASSDARTWYVKPDSTGDAPTIQAAMNIAQPGDEVLLAPGTYSWTTQGTGGTSYGESMIEVRPGVSLRGEAGPESTILDAEYRARVILCLNAGDVRIEGVTATRGWYPSSGISGNGGGINSFGSSKPVISNCIIRQNRVNAGLDGAGLSCQDAGATVLNCLIYQNVGDFPDVAGGGIFIVGGSVVGCTIRDHALFGDAGSAGGAILAIRTNISDCLIEGNSAGNVFGALGGGVRLRGPATISRCMFINNVVSGGTDGARGGAIYCSSGDISIRDCIFVGNRAEGDPAVGGAIAAASTARLTISGCTLVTNKGRGTTPVGGIALVDPGEVSNTIVALSEGAACSGPIKFSCTDLYGNSLGDAFCGTDAGGNFSADPQFCAEDPASSLNVWLQGDSPCAPGNHPGGASCGLIGARAVGCGTVLVERRTWSDVKLMYRR